MAYSNFGAQFQAFVIRLAEVCKTFTTKSETSAINTKVTNLESRIKTIEDNYVTKTNPTVSGTFTIEE